MCAFFKDKVRAGIQYSNVGLTSDLYNCTIKSLLLHKNVPFIIPETAFAAAALTHCLFRFRVLSLTTSKSFSSV